MGISDYDISSTLATSVSQRLVRRVCPHCAAKRDFTNEEKERLWNIVGKYNYNLYYDNKFTYDVKGCEKCNYTGYLDRIGIFEILEMNDEIKELIMTGNSTLKIKEAALRNGYLPLEVDAVRKVMDGITTLEEINRVLALY